MNTIQYTPDDYCIYLRMTERTHVLLGSREEREIFLANPSSLPVEQYKVDFDVVGDLVRFEEPLSERDKIERLQDCAIKTELTDKLYVIDNLNFYLPEGNETQQDTNANNQEGLPQRIEDVMNQLSLNHITIPAPDEIRSYLFTYSDMADVLSSVTDIVTERFRESARLSLEIYKDPEAEDKYLSLYIRQENYDDAFFESLNDVRARYNELLNGKTGWIVVTTDFNTQGE
jgi:hypothetical protein